MMRSAIVSFYAGYVLRGGRYRTPEEEVKAQEQGDTPVDYFGKALLASGEVMASSPQQAHFE